MEPGGDEGDDDGPDVQGGTQERDVSCIGVRKVCLQKDRCNQLLVDFREHCRESKKLNECIAPDWYVPV